VSLRQSAMMACPTHPITPRQLAPDAPVGIRVLLVADTPAGIAMVDGCFDGDTDRAPSAVVERVGRLASARERLAGERFDVVLLDLSLPDASGLGGVESLCAVAPDVPIVVLAEPDEERLAVAAVKAGAQDYLTKGQDDGRIVQHAVRHAVERHRLRREREALLAREREARAAAERASRVRDEVLGLVSHDLRSPIKAIAMSGNALLEGGATSACWPARSCGRASGRCASSAICSTSRRSRRGGSPSIPSR
jgi:DNA-binding NarL/FixJ family response regulator